MAIVYRVKKPYANPAEANRAAWVARIMAGAENTAAKIGVTPEAIVAQAALESGWGKAGIGNNIFGIKANGSWTGPRQSVRTREVLEGKEVFITDDFRDYPTVEASIEDHFEFLRKNGRYARAGVFDPNNEKSDFDYFKALQAAGYATDPNYAVVLKSVLLLVQQYTANMERVDLGDYKVDSQGNVKSVPAAQSTTVKDSNKGTLLATAGGVATAVTPAISAFGSLDWRVAVVIGVVAVICIGGAVFYFAQIKATRRQMEELGVL